MVPDPQVILLFSRQITLNTKNVNHDKWEQILAMIVHVDFNVWVNYLMEVWTICIVDRYISVQMGDFVKSDEVNKKSIASPIQIPVNETCNFNRY